MHISESTRNEESIGLYEEGVSVGMCVKSDL